MMKISISLILLLSGLWAVAEAQTLRYQGNELPMRDQARACYLSFIKLYDAAYFADDTGETRCVKLDYLREFDSDELREATEQVFVDRHGKQARTQFAEAFVQMVDAYQAVGPGDSYQYCTQRGNGGAMLRDGQVVASVDDSDFSERFMRIWVKGEQAGKPDWAFSRCPVRTF